MMAIISCTVDNEEVIAHVDILRAELSVIADKFPSVSYDTSMRLQKAIFALTDVVFGIEAEEAGKC
jgi:hypothetical protein